MGEQTRETLKLQFDKRLRLEFQGARITSDAGLLSCRELDEVLGLTEAAPNYLRDTRGGRNVQHELVPLLRQSVYSHLAGYEDTNDAVRLARDPAMQAVVGRRALEEQAASTNTLSWSETEVLVTEENLRSLGRVNTEWVDRAMVQTRHQRIILDMDSSESPRYMESRREQPTTATSSACAITLSFASTSSGTAKGRCYGRAMSIVLSVGGRSWSRLWSDTRREGCGCCSGGMLPLPNRRYTNTWSHGTPAMPSGCLPTRRLQEHIKHLLKRPVGRPPKKPIVWYHDFQYQAGRWNRPRRVVAKVEWHRGELFPRVGFIVTNLSAKAKGIVHFYNGRGTAEQWIKEGKYALNWTRLSCHRFVANQVRLQLFILAYNLGNFLRRLSLPRAVKGWSLRSLQLKLIKMGGRIVRHARQIVFQLAEVAVPRDLFAAILERVTRLRLASG